MSLALCAVLAAPPRLRPAVARAMAAFAVAVCYSFLALGWHYPSDVLGGFLVALDWTLLGAAALVHGSMPRWPTPRWRRGTPRQPSRSREALAPVAAGRWAPGLRPAVLSRWPARTR